MKTAKLVFCDIDLTTTHSTPTLKRLLKLNIVKLDKELGLSLTKTEPHTITLRTIKDVISSVSFEYPKDKEPS